MSQKRRGSEKLLNPYGEIGNCQREDFLNIEALLEARGAAGFYLQPWWIRGLPAFLDTEAINPVADPVAAVRSAKKF